MRRKARRPLCRSVFCARWVPAVATDAHTFSLSLDGSTRPAGPRVATQPSARPRAAAPALSVRRLRCSAWPTRSAPLHSSSGSRLLGSTSSVPAALATLRAPGRPTTTTSAHGRPNTARHRALSGAVRRPTAAAATARWWARAASRRSASPSRGGRPKRVTTCVRTCACP